MEHKAADDQYCNDIQALRGLAVLLVVFYHTDLFSNPASYLDIDIFFVISGYLITILILRQINDDSFSFLNFYLHRAKPLLPAAYIVLFFIIILTRPFINSNNIQDPHKQIIRAITFTPNFFHGDQTGYFDNGAEKKSLLVFRSLAIDTTRTAGKKVVVLASPPADGINISYCLERKALNKITFRTSTVVYV